jgi:hypothetical protein
MIGQGDTPNPAPRATAPPLSARRRAAARALALAVCPPDMVALGLVDDVVDHLQRTLDSIGALPRRMIGVALDGLDAGARVRHGRRLDRLSDERVAEYVTTLSRSRSRSIRQGLRLVRDLLVMAYYDQPVVKQRLGYDPDAWTATVAPARAERWAEAIERHREVVVRPSPAPRGTSA